MRTARGLRYLLVITDRFEKLVCNIPLRGVTVAEAATQLVNNWVFSYGPRIELIADNGCQFTSGLFQDVFKMLNVHNSFKTTYHPQTNGHVERFDGTILRALHAYISDYPHYWDLYMSILT